MTQKKRLNYLDIAKGIGMLTIIWGHIMENGPTNVFVYSFHIPLFFFMSGIVFRRDKYHSFKEFATRKIKTLVVPYIIFSFLTWCIWVVYNIASHGNVDSYCLPLLQTLIAQGSGGYLVHNVPLWYVSCLIVIEFLYYFISRAKSEPVVIFWCVFLALCSYLMERYITVFDYKLLPWSLGAACAGIVFYAVGNLLDRHGIIDKAREQLRRKPFFFLIMLTFMTAILIYLSALNGHVSMGHEQYGKSRLLFYFNGLLGTCCVLLFSSLIERFSLVSIIRWIGFNSLYFMFVENPIKGFVVVIISKMMHVSGEELSASIIHSLIAFIFSTLVTVIAVKCILFFLRVLKKHKASIA